MPSRAAHETAWAEPSFAEHVCLALVANGSSHGWAVGTELAPAGSLGRIWTLSRPLTYRAIDGLVDKGLVRRARSAEGRGSARRALAVTTAGRRALRRWLDHPVQHVRDVRTELLVKLVLREWAGLDNEALLAAQQAVFAPLIDGLLSSPEGDLVDLWRRESARAVERFLDQASRTPTVPVEAPGRRLSARNQIRLAAEDLDLAPGGSIVVAVYSVNE
jgi:DNA-binding PadR family transcriptional regulator